jgi:hypothetical protein
LAIFSDEIEILDPGNALNRILRKGGNLYGAGHICSQSCEVPECESTDSSDRHFPAESNSQIFPCEAAVAGQYEPQKCPNSLAHDKTHGERQESDQPEGKQCENVNQTICHDGK